MQIERTGTQLRVISEHWTALHDLTSGGVWTELRLLYGAAPNLSTRPVGAAVDGAAEQYARQATVTASAEGDEATVIVRGKLTDAEGNPGGVAYTHTYHYTPWFIRHTLHLVPDTAMRIRHLTALEMQLDPILDEYSFGSTNFARIQPRYMHIVGPHYDDIWGRRPGRDVIAEEDAQRPWQVAVFRRGGDGLQWCGDSRQYQWDNCLAAGAGSYRLSYVNDCPVLTLSPYSGKPVTMAEPVTLSWYIVPANLPALGCRRYYEVAIATCPFPDEKQLDLWADSGVNLLRIHEGTDVQGQTADYWHDGEFPPYNPAKMRKLEKFQAQCRRRGLKLIPYFSGWELAPDTPAFAAHGREWAATAKPNGQIRYTPCGGAGVYGALMCPDSGWGEYLDAYIGRCVDELGFDGYYLDWSSPGPCANERHMPGPHNGADALVGMLARHRRWLGNDRVLVIHTGGQLMWLLHHNVADQTVTLEEGKKTGSYSPETLDEYPASVRFMPAISVSIVPNVLHRQKGDAPGGERLRRGISHLVLFGALPYSYWTAEPQAFGYSSREALYADPQGLYASYRLYSQYDWAQYKFHDVNSGAVRATDSRVGAAIYARPGEALVVVSNISGDAVPAGEVGVSPEIAAKYRLGERLSYPALQTWEHRLLPLGSE